MFKVRYMDCDVKKEVNLKDVKDVVNLIVSITKDKRDIMHIYYWCYNATSGERINDKKYKFSIQCYDEIVQELDKPQLLARKEPRLSKIGDISLSSIIMNEKEEIIAVEILEMPILNKHRIKVHNYKGRLFITFKNNRIYIDEFN